MQSVPDLERCMYASIDGNPCVRLLNLTGEIVCANLGRHKVTAPITRFKSSHDLVLTRPSAVLVKLSEFNSLVAKMESDMSFSRNVAGVLVEAGGVNSSIGFSPDEKFPLAEFAALTSIDLAGHQEIDIDLQLSSEDPRGMADQNQMQGDLRLPTLPPRPVIDWGAKLAECVAPLAAEAFPVDSWTPSVIPRAFTTVPRFIKILCKENDAAVFVKLVHKGSQDEFWQTPSTCTVKQKFKFCFWLRTRMDLRSSVTVVRLDAWRSELCLIGSDRPSMKAGKQRQRLGIKSNCTIRTLLSISF
ncbi:hypothetical protein QQ045_007454 [Rhodiola kirilowii]